MLLAIFLCCVALIAYPVAIYPLLVMTLARVRPRLWKEDLHRTDCALIITVHNEARRIRAKLENTLALTRPVANVDIVVVSDGSTDATRDIVAEFAEEGVRWIDCPRRGKEAAQIDGIRATRAELLVFSDAATLIEPDGLVEILRPFADPSVGAVSGTDMVSTTGSLGEDLYLRYEMALRRAESLCSSIIGLSGCFFATRRKVANELVANVPSDFGAALISIRRNLRAVGQPSARCTYAPTPDPGSLFRRMRRTVLRGIRCIWVYRNAMSLRRPVASWQIVSHKLLRFLAPLIGAFAVGLAAYAGFEGQTWGLAACLVTVLSLAVGLISLFSKNALLVAFRPVGFFYITFAAVLAAWFSLLWGQKGVTWTPTARS